MSLLETKMVAKPWGVEKLPAPFIAPPGEKIGEVWFQPPPELDRLLVKYLFIHRNGDYILLEGRRFPRLKAASPVGKLAEAVEMLRTF